MVRCGAVQWIDKTRLPDFTGVNIDITLCIARRLIDTNKVVANEFSMSLASFGGFVLGA